MPLIHTYNSQTYMCTCLTPLPILVTLLVSCMIIPTMMIYIMFHSISLHLTLCTMHSMQLTSIEPYTCI